MDRRAKLKNLIEELVKIPSITESERESEPAFLIRERLGRLRYFMDNPEYLQLVETPREGASAKLYALVARVDAETPTKRTALLISHFDVVDTRAYGELAGYAFDPAELRRRLGTPDDDQILYGRGVMDMKCGVALEVDILEEFAEDRALFDINIVAVFVGDEENSSAGMRGVLPALAAMRGAGLDFLAAVNTEPGEAGQTGKSGPMAYLGTLGKLMPSFYVRGRPAHVGNYYHGYSAALVAASIIMAAEGSPDLADPLHGIAHPSWICLDTQVIKDSYSVTVPYRAYVYFNCFTTTNTPGDVVKQMEKIAFSALDTAAAHCSKSCAGLDVAGYDGEKFLPPPAKVFTLSKLTAKARQRYGEGFDSELENFVKSLPPGDMRDRGIAVTDKIASLSGEEEPYVVCFFLPPWLPVRTNFTGDARDSAVIGAVRSVGKELYDKFELELTETEMFAGLCDLSYAGGKVSDSDMDIFAKNLPGFGDIYQLPLEEMRSLGLPVVNLGPSGEDAHKKTERLNLRYSLEILPGLLRHLIRQLSERVF